MSGHFTARVLIFTHRWLGIGLGFLFIIWFLSGIVMIYAPMPALDPIERLARLTALMPASIRVDPPASGGELSQLSIGSLEGRPIYRLTIDGRRRFVFADTGDDVPPVDAEQALRIAKAFVGSAAARHEARLADADQWTFDVRRQMPVHRIAIDDAAGTRLYVPAMARSRAKKSA